MKKAICLSLLALALLAGCDGPPATPSSTSGWQLPALTKPTTPLPEGCVWVLEYGNANDSDGRSYAYQWYAPVCSTKSTSGQIQVPPFFMQGCVYNNKGICK